MGCEDSEQVDGLDLKVAGRVHLEATGWGDQEAKAPSEVGTFDARVGAAVVSSACLGLPHVVRCRTARAPAAA